MARPFDGPRTRRTAPPRARGGVRRGPEPGLLVRQCRVGPGRLVRRRLPVAGPARAMARPHRAGGRLHGHRRHHQAATRDPRPACRGRHHPARVVALRRDGPRRPDRWREADRDDRPGRARDGGHPLDPVRAVARRPHPADRRRRRGLPVPDRERLQPVGARPVRSRGHPREDRPVGVRRGARHRSVRRRQRRLRGRAGTGRRDRPARRGVPGRPMGRGAGAGPAHAARRPGGARARILRAADTRPRTLRLPVLRARAHPGGHLATMAARVCRPERRDVPEHVRGADHAVPRQPVGQGLARDRSGHPLRSWRRPRRPAPHRRLRVVRLPASLQGP